MAMAASPKACLCLSPEEFRTFALTHPEYAKLFTTYLELQRYQALQETEPEPSQPANSTCPEDVQEDSTSDKKED